MPPKSKSAGQVSRPAAATVLLHATTGKAPVSCGASDDLSIVPGTPIKRKRDGSSHVMNSSKSAANRVSTVTSKQRHNEREKVLRGMRDVDAINARRRHPTSAKQDASDRNPPSQTERAGATPYPVASPTVPVRHSPGRRPEEILDGHFCSQVPGDACEPCYGVACLGCTCGHCSPCGRQLSDPQRRYRDVALRNGHNLGYSRPDGNCLMHTLSIHSGVTAEQCRADVSETLCHLSPSLQLPGGLLHFDDHMAESITDYAARIQSDGAWAGEAEIIAAARKYSLQVTLRDGETWTALGSPYGPVGGRPVTIVCTSTTGATTTDGRALVNHYQPALPFLPLSVDGRMKVPYIGTCILPTDYMEAANPPKVLPTSELAR